MRVIRKVAVLGAGVMGSTIAAHLANAGLDVLLLDIVPKDLTEEEKARGLTLEDKQVRNRIVIKALENLKKMKPAALYHKDYINNIEIGNFEDDMAKIRDCDWVIEVVVENMDIKKSLLKDKIIPNISDTAILSSNTSGLSINEMAEVVPDDLKKRFLITHFFNPPRYMRLMEIVPSKYTDPEIVKFMADFISFRLGKGIVYAKDTPNFIGNRIGVYAMFAALKHMQDLDLTVEEVDSIAGPLIGLPKTAIFRLADLVGIDTMVHVANNTYQLLDPSIDDEREIYKVPAFLEDMVKKGLLGNKTKQGFYKKEKVEGKKVVYYYDIKTGEYKPATKPSFPSTQAASQGKSLKEKINILINGKDKAAQFAWRLLRDILIYSFKRIPEIADDVVNVDNAMKWGYNWQMGPFELFDAIGVNQFVKKAKEDGVALPEKLENIEVFYKLDGAKELYFDILSGEYKEVPRKETYINLDILKKTGNLVEQNSGASIIDLGDGVFNLEFHTKMNAIGAEIVSMAKKAIKRAEEEGVALVISNQGRTFSVGANLFLIATSIAEGAFDEINMAVKQFQNMTMGFKYARVPVVAAPFQMTLGGGCETCLHCDAIVAHAETYMGLVEVGVGLIPAGGGTKEMALRVMELVKRFKAPDFIPFLAKYFENIAMAKVSTSAREAFELGYMDDSDSVTMDIDNLIYDAKQVALALARNYRPKKPATNLPAPGRDAFATIKNMLWTMYKGNYISEYDMKVGEKIAYVMCGGDVAPATMITEEYLLDLEREAFLSLCGEKKTIERIQHMLKTGKPLRN
ncbi:3-hydroxyacyl-CoA dehydrogenase/enoyl-CoA hydratase family protein [Hippea jasoniae]|uniref:3-hydroxyacyl-CoA dehydrogenase/enoyl-CoA hydratase family protein n=1 Tax=Hippea jasoniae TaxID=944479 RepID=UPI0005562EB7|nr:3-hydroxyacyl-CoA dehydrogenase/enoyl-CoA hydratase family protein [Hippea jasoniae]